MLMWALIVVLGADQKPVMFGMYESQERCVQAREALKAQQRTKGFQAPGECFQMVADAMQGR